MRIYSKYSKPLVAQDGLGHKDIASFVSANVQKIGRYAE
jgi:hypothetical protein